MYARSFEKDRRPFQIPEHYSGSLFAEPSRTPAKAEQAYPIGQDSKRETNAEGPLLFGGRIEQKTDLSDRVLPSAEISETVQKLVGKIYGGLGFDRLLILGLMLLLSGAEGGSELILWLALLLFI